MARKKGGLNKSAKVRELLSENPDLSVKDVVSSLAGKGIQVKPNLVYFIKAKARAGKRKRARQRVEAAITAGNGPRSASAIDIVRQLKGLANQVGGIRKLKTLVDMLAE